MAKKNYTYEERMAAVRLYIKYDLNYSAVYYELGYPSRNRLRIWYKEYNETGDLKEDGANMRKYSKEQRQAAVTYYLEHGKSIAKTISALGYPGKTVLCDWLNKDLASEQRKWRCKAGTSLVRCNEEQKQEAVIAYVSGQSTPHELSKIYGISARTIYGWRDKYLTNGCVGKMPKVKHKESADELKNRINDLEERAKELEKEVFRLQLERDVLAKAAEIIKKDQGVSLPALTNREKTIVIDALRDQYKLKDLLSVLHIAKSSYCYNAAVLRAPDKYADVRSRVTDLFYSVSKRYGYRRIHVLLKRENIIVSEKVVRRIMREESLVVPFVKMKKYSSYVGEVTPAVENLVKRDFHADKPNKLWLTDITEFHIPAGKIYLSPMIDCFDGLPVSWTIGTSPNAELANTMLDIAIKTLADNEHPVVHTDRGGHYRWPGWIDRMEKARLTRSMSKKGCSPDNAACEGFHGRLKNEFFYNRDWRDVTVEEFIDQLDEYLHWYSEERIKISLGGMSPIEYRRTLGLCG